MEDPRAGACSVSLGCLEVSQTQGACWGIVQSILTLVHIRRAHHLFPLRPYLPQLVGALEDTDGNVRECARQSVVELFTGPGVTDMARTDLKKEMTKKGVRKTIVDGVLSKVLSGGGGSNTPATMSEAGSEDGDIAGAAREYVPPSIALMQKRPRPTVAGAAAHSSGAVSRTVSQGNIREIPRPASRAAAMSPTGEGPSTTGSGPDVKAVYVSDSLLICLLSSVSCRGGWRASLTVLLCNRLLRAAISRASSLRCCGHLRYVGIMKDLPPFPSLTEPCITSSGEGNGTQLGSPRAGYSASPRHAQRGGA